LWQEVPALAAIGLPAHIERMAAKRPKRPRDPSQLGKFIVGVATGEIQDRELTPEEQGKNPAAVALGQKGGKARARSMSKKRRAEIARKAAKSRWSK
jgi:hypothetical protein